MKWRKNASGYPEYYSENHNYRIARHGSGAPYELYQIQRTPNGYPLKDKFIGFFPTLKLAKAAAEA